MKILKEVMQNVMQYGVIPAIIWEGIPFCMGWGISRLFISGCITVNHITITDINLFCGILALSVGLLLYSIYLFKK